MPTECLLLRIYAPVRRYWSGLILGLGALEVYSVGDDANTLGAVALSTVRSRGGRLKSNYVCLMRDDLN